MSGLKCSLVIPRALILPNLMAAALPIWPLVNQYDTALRLIPARRAISAFVPKWAWTSSKAS